MKHACYILTLSLGLFACNQRPETAGGICADTDTTGNTVKLHPLEKLFIVGDFNGDGKRDTVFQHNYSHLTKSEINFSADPFQNEWDVVAKWFYDQDANVYLTLNKNKQDTLFLGTAQGLYCLINIGDNNNDRKDEIAFVVDYLDHSRVNSCKIYSLCTNTWQELKQFGIHEGSFDFDSEKMPAFDQVKDHLEKQNGKWFYKDYLQETYDNAEDVSKMQVLELGRCKENKVPH